MMPVKSSDEIQKLYFMTQDGTKYEFSGIQSIDVDDGFFNDDHDELASRFLFSSNEATFSASFNINVILLYFLTHGRYPSNNWRRMHGLRPKRKVKSQNKRRSKCSKK